MSDKQWEAMYWDKSATTGAVMDECPCPRYCRCGKCWCGNSKHTAIHGPILGRSDDKPYGHVFSPALAAPPAKGGE